MKFFYEEQTDLERLSDIGLNMAIDQGYVPSTCLLAGVITMSEVQRSNDPCAGCNTDRLKCHGRPKSERV